MQSGQEESFLQDDSITGTFPEAKGRLNKFVLSPCPHYEICHGEISNMQ